MKFQGSVSLPALELNELCSESAACATEKRLSSLLDERRPRPSSRLMSVKQSLVVRGRSLSRMSCEEERRRRQSGESQE